ncbi:MAG: sugar transporter, partial [Deltaproteobacteria bacterium]|nr:sugar transporter [Deltaproteobacteria bacterium]
MAQQSPLHADETLRLTRAWVAWSETVLVTAFLPILGFWIDKRDPFFLSASFPW